MFSTSHPFHCVCFLESQNLVKSAEQIPYMVLEQIFCDNVGFLLFFNDILCCLSDLYVVDVAF